MITKLIYLLHKKKIERDKECKYSILMDLPYLIRMFIINFMHNLLLGTAKMAHSWTELGLLTESQEAEIQKSR